MNSLKDRSEEDLLSKMKDNCSLCQKYAGYEPDNEGIHMSVLASNLLLQMAEQDKKIDAAILNELASLIFQQSSAEFREASQVLQLKNLVIFAELSERRSQYDAHVQDRNERGISDNSGEYRHVQDDLNSSLPLQFPPCPIPVKSENDGCFEMMEDCHTGEASEGIQEENEESNTIMTEGAGTTVVRREVEKKCERTPTARCERRKRTHSTAAANFDGNQVENSTLHPIKRKSSRAKSSAITKRTSVDRVSNNLKKVGKAQSKKVLGYNGMFLVDQVKSLKTKEIAWRRTTNSPLSKLAASFGQKVNTFDCPFCQESLGGGGLNYHVKLMHDKEREKVFGCKKCDVWCMSVLGAYRHYMKNGCLLSVRSIEEARKAEKLLKANGGEEKMAHQKEPTFEDIAKNEEE